MGTLAQCDSGMHHEKEIVGRPGGAGRGGGDAKDEPERYKGDVSARIGPCGEDNNDCDVVVAVACFCLRCYVLPSHEENSWIWLVIIRRFHVMFSVHQHGFVHVIPRRGTGTPATFGEREGGEWW